MTWNRKLQKARQLLDRRLAPLQPAQDHQPPPRGWIRALRDAVGMSAAQLGQRLGIRSQSVDDLEKNEVSGGISLAALQRVAQAMDCTLVYALVPNQSLTALVQRRAEAMARDAVAGVSHSMALEDQQVTEDLERQIADHIDDNISERDLWSS